jgi:hypothetical protein
MRVRLSLIAIFVYALSSVAAAQPGPTYVECLDTLAIDSRGVFVATVSDLCDAAHCSAGNNAVLKVERYLKGNAGDRFQFALDAPPPLIAEWKAQGSRLLIFDQLTDDPGSGGASSMRIVDLSQPTGKVLTADMRVLSDGQQILEAAQQAIERNPNVLRMVTFERPLTGDAAKAFGGFSPVTRVPADAELERWAIGVLQGKPGDSSRWQAVQALGLFQSEETTRLLTSLLNDPATVVMQRAENNLGVEVQAYPVREQAYQVLRGWGVAVEQPVLRVETTRLDAVKVVDLSNRAERVHHTDIDALVKFPNLEALRMENDRATSQAYRSLAALKTLRTLDLRGTKFNDSYVHWLSGLDALASLNLEGTKITDAGIKELAGLSALKSLDLRGTGVSDGAVSELRSVRPDIEVEQ